MAFVSFLGRVLFVSAFILSTLQEYNEFGVDGGLAARTLRPKFDALSKNVLSQTRFKLPAIEMKYLVATAIALKGFGSLLFIFGSSLGAYLFCIKHFLHLSCMTSTTMMQTKNSFLHFSPSLHRMCNCWERYSSLLA